MKLNLTTIFLLIFSISISNSHGFGERIDLPIPLELYLLGAGVTIILSFFVISTFSNKLEGKTELIQFSKNSKLNLAVNKLLIFLKVFLVIVLAVVIIACFFGRQIPIFNIAPIVVWIYFGVGMTYAVSLFGNIWEKINPFKTIFEFIESSYMHITKKELSPLSNYPLSWGFWPAILFFFQYRLIENADIGAEIPHTLGLLILFYSAITFLGMIYFGKKNWLKYCDPFSVFFHLLSKFSILETISTDNHKKINLRLPGLGLLEKENINFSLVVFVLFMLSSISYDALKETSVWYSQIMSLFKAGIPLVIIHALGLIVLCILFILVYLFFCFLIKRATKIKRDYSTIIFGFLFSLIPIAVAYEIAHYMTLLLIEGQRIFYLISDPFGFGWNIFGTNTLKVNYGVVNFSILWNLQVILIIIGHIIGIYIAHSASIDIFKQKEEALRSQYPMLVLMILYTLFSLWIISQPFMGD